VSHTQYKCEKCPGYCCSYPLIPLDKRDVERLAKHHGISFKEAKASFTKEDHGHKYAMRRKKDPLYGRICRFFDTKKRRCTIYKARPAVCRSFPGGGRCGYYDFLSFERRAQEDNDFVALTNHDED
jgi:Fe-S-cluster containining protein